MDDINQQPPHTQVFLQFNFMCCRLDHDLKKAVSCSAGVNEQKVIVLVLLSQPGAWCTPMFLALPCEIITNKLFLTAHNSHEHVFHKEDFEIHFYKSLCEIKWLVFGVPGVQESEDSHSCFHCVCVSCRFSGLFIAMIVSLLFLVLLRFMAGVLFWIFIFGVIGIIGYGKCNLASETIFPYCLSFSKENQ